jgi:hypothetical protein
LNSGRKDEGEIENQGMRRHLRKWEGRNREMYGERKREFLNSGRKDEGEIENQGMGRQQRK